MKYVLAIILLQMSGCYTKCQDMPFSPSQSCIECEEWLRKQQQEIAKREAEEESSKPEAPGNGEAHGCNP